MRLCWVIYAHVNGNCSNGYDCYRDYMGEQVMLWFLNPVLYFFGSPSVPTPVIVPETILKKKVLAYKEQEFNLQKTYIEVTLEDGTQLTMYAVGCLRQRTNSGISTGDVWAEELHIDSSYEQADQLTRYLTINAEYGLSDYRYPEIKHYSKPNKAVIMNTEDFFQMEKVAYVT
jgi:hypothetical protein